MSSQNHETFDTSAINLANSNLRPRLSPESNVRIMNPSRSQLARQKNKEDAEFIEGVLESVTPGSLGEQCVGKFKYFYNEADDDDSPAIALKEKVAKALCKQCPIMEKCLEDGLSQGDVPGIWGGMTKNERRNYANKRRRL